jgi:hypothetical protein
VRGACGAGGGVDRARGSGLSGGVVIECERHVRDSDVGERFEEPVGGRRASERRDVVDPMRAEDVDIEYTFDEQEVSTLGA